MNPTEQTAPVPPASLGWARLALALCVVPWISLTAAQEVRSFSDQIEADWLLQESYRTNQLRTGVSVPSSADATGGCDGIKTGGWGFHTGQQLDPWWAVDLGAACDLDRVLVWNRCDPELSASVATNLSVRISADGQEWQTIYQHDGSTFLGQRDKKPLHIAARPHRARFVRIQLSGERFLHLDEVEVFGSTDTNLNLALGRPADQCSTSTWSLDHRPLPDPDWNARTADILAHVQRLHRERAQNASSPELRSTLDRAEKKWAELKSKLAGMPPAAPGKPLFLEARWLQRQLTFLNPVLDVPAILVTKRVPGSYSHMSDQYYGWWSRPGGGIYLLRGFQQDRPELECLTASFTEAGSFLRPTLSYDGTKVLFAWCRHYPQLAGEKNKLNKAAIPEDAFYHVFEMNVDGGGVRQLTRGKYDNFDARYLPDGRIVFLSTRRGQSLQVGRASAQQTLSRPELPDCYVRCGGDEYRPVAVYTLHTMKADGSDLTAISPFEMFEWEPSVAHDGSILHARWDYIDRDNMPFMSLWAINPDGTNPRLVYKNYTRSPHCVFEPQAVPGSRKIVFTASGHHSHTMGSLALLDPAAGTEGPAPIKRLTPEVPFPEIEAWPVTYYASPWPFSERFYLVSWGDEGASTHAGRWHRAGGRWEGISRPKNAMGVYFFDAEGNMELLCRDPEISTLYPIPLLARDVPPALPSVTEWDGPQEGRFLVHDVYDRVPADARTPIQRLRVIAVPAKTQPWMNRPEIGVTRDDPGKCVLGTVPVEPDGSAFFRVPSGVIVFFQTLDERGRAVRTMRSATHVQPGQTVSCIGCHADRTATPSARIALASTREPSKITMAPPGAWPLRFDTLIQPVLDQNCTSCHRPDAADLAAAKVDLTAPKAYDTLTRYGSPSIQDVIMKGYREGVSRYGEGPARQSALLNFLDRADRRCGGQLDAAAFERFATWIDTYSQRAGSFSPEQEEELERLQRDWSDLLEPHPAPTAVPVASLSPP